jgi:Zn-dependent protease with chaperone function
MVNFFQQQQAARRRTFWLVAYFIAAVIALVLLTYLVVAGIFVYEGSGVGKPKISWWNPGLFAAVSAGVLLFIGGCTTYKVAELSSGGSAVALLVGGQEIQGNTTDLSERRLLNIIEEMSIASGVPVPAVYVLEEEDGINAFAAGYSPRDAVVAVSRGCLNYLDRDELQGVVAHEFSHILNGDMRLDIRFMGIVFGIMGLAIIGQILIRSTYYRGSSSDRDSKGSGQILLVGLALYLLGIAGAFFGNLIKAAISRQREFLADASAVQFTRNPDGIGGALKKIGGLEKGPNIDNPHAAEASHMFFADALAESRLMSLFATHPPLEERIKRIDPSWDGVFPDVKTVGVRPEEEAPRPKRVPPLSAGMPGIPGIPQVPFPILAEAEDAVNRTGRLTRAQTGYAATLAASIPDVLREAASEPFSARAVIYGLLLDRDPAVRQAQLARLRQQADPRDYEETQRLAGPIAALPEAVALPLVDVAMPALRRMSPQQYNVFRSQFEQLILADQKVSVFEFVLRCVVQRRLDANFRRPRPQVRQPAGPPTSRVIAVLSLLAWEGHETEEAARKGYEAGIRRYLLGEERVPPMLSRDEATLERFGQALESLAVTPPAAKRRVLMACAACIAADRKTTVREAELYRAIGSVLDCPIPPAQPAEAASA